jgi:response regulator RpfG family c-di-GMP phosphodiesterase
LGGHQFAINRFFKLQGGRVSIIGDPPQITEDAMSRVDRRLADTLANGCGLAWEYLFYLKDECKRLRNATTSLLIGLVTAGLAQTLSPLPILVSWVVLAMANAFERFRKRDEHDLLLLPGRRDDPAFITDHGGRVVQAAGRTDALLKSRSVEHLADLIGPHQLERMLTLSDKNREAPQTGSIECYAEPLRNWYEIKFLPVYSRCGRLPAKVLVWFNNITARKELERRQHDLLAFSDHLIANIKAVAKEGGGLDRLAGSLLGNYRGIFISRLNRQSDLVGHVYKHGAPITRSKKITIPKDSVAPVLLSRRLQTVMSDERRNYPSSDEFSNKYPFDERVVSFLGEPIENFINYHAGDISVIAFNSVRGVGPGEHSFIETLLNLFRSIGALIDLARENEEQFLQKVMGLCAAAEYSDELTGRHILRVNAYSRLIVQELGMGREFSENIGRVAALHDIGKVAVPELIKLQRRYSSEERLRMQMHTIYGAHIIASMMKYSQQDDPRMRMAYNVALHHHQTFSGTGYPKLKKQNAIIEPHSKHYQDYEHLQPLAGAEIPIESLIVGLADRYDALRTKRPYKESYSHERVLSILSYGDGSGQKAEEIFGHEIWAVFIKNHHRFKDIYESMQNWGDFQSIEKDL